jgi:hypothetical protein
VRGSDDDPYEVFYSHGDWRCNCQARVLECTHIVACQKISVFEPVEFKIFSPDEDEITRMLASL